ncbi:MAG: tripartite tricarboxylate transporter TctB family protein [Burkholderiaceae bacterium]
MKLNDAVFGLLLTVFGLAILFAIRNFPSIPGQSVGPALFPGMIATGLCIGGVLLMVQGWRVRRVVPWVSWQDWVRSPRHVLALVLLVASVVFYMLAAQRLGFLICAPVILTALFVVLRVPLGRAVLVAVVASLVIHFAFYKLLRVPLPWGILVNYAW